MAVTKVEKWATGDGQLFDTQRDAVEHEQNIKGKRLVERMLESANNYLGLSDDCIRNVALVLGSTLDISLRKAWPGEETVPIKKLADPEYGADGKPRRTRNERPAKVR